MHECTQLTLYSHFFPLQFDYLCPNRLLSNPSLKYLQTPCLPFFFGLQVTEKQPVLFGPTGGQLCLPAGQLTTQSTSLFRQVSNLAVCKHLRASKLHSWINWLPGQEMCIFLMGSCQVKKIYEVSEATNHSKHIPSEQKKPWGKRYSPESHFHLVAFYSRILYNTPFKVSSSKAIRSTILYIYIVAVCYVVCEQSYLCCIYFTIIFHRYFHNIKKALIILILMLWVL